jgi:hypothetical protein
MLSEKNDNVEKSAGLKLNKEVISDPYLSVPAVLTSPITFESACSNESTTMPPLFTILYANRALIAKLDKKSYDGLKIILAVAPFGLLFMLARSHYQKYDSALFLKDYGIKRFL